MANNYFWQSQHLHKSEATMVIFSPSILKYVYIWGGKMASKALTEI